MFKEGDALWKLSCYVVLMEEPTGITEAELSSVTVTSDFWTEKHFFKASENASLDTWRENMLQIL